MKKLGAVFLWQIGELHKQQREIFFLRKMTIFKRPSWWSLFLSAVPDAMTPLIVYGFEQNEFSSIWVFIDSRLPMHCMNFLTKASSYGTAKVLLTRMKSYFDARKTSLLSPSHTDNNDDSRDAHWRQSIIFDMNDILKDYYDVPNIIDFVICFNDIGSKKDIEQWNRVLSSCLDWLSTSWRFCSA